MSIPIYNTNVYILLYVDDENMYVHADFIFYFFIFCLLHRREYVHSDLCVERATG